MTYPLNISTSAEIITKYLPESDIPVSFDYKGKHYEGVLTPVAGAAGNMWHLIDR